jgi:glycosyltransferase involved in cell wall biosynthesis
MNVLVFGSKEYPALFRIEGCGGIEVHVEHVIKELKDHVNFTVLTRLGSYDSEDGNLKVFYVPYLRGRLLRTFSFNFFSFILSLFLLPKYNIHIIHSNDLISGLFGVILKKIFKRPLVLSIPTFGSRQPEWRYFIKTLLSPIECYCMKNADRIFTFSSMDTRMISDRWSLRNAKLLGNGVDIEDFKGAQPIQLSDIDPAISREATVITFIGRLTKSKGLDVLIKAFNMLLKEEEVVLLLIGDGPEEKHLKKLVERNVFFLGRRRNIAGFLKASDICVVPSLYEGLPIALLEAMASETAVVASRVGAIPDIIEEGKNGLLVEPGNIEELVDKILFLVREPAEAKKLSRNAYSTVRRHFSWKKISNRVYEAYETLFPLSAR